MLKSSSIIFQTLFFFLISSGLAIIRKVNRRSPDTTSVTRLTLIAVLVVKGLLRLKPLPSRLSLNLLCHPKTRMHNIVLSPDTCWNSSSACDGVFSKLDQKFQIYSLLGVQTSFSSAYSEKGCINKSKWEKCNGCRRLRWQFIYYQDIK